MQSVYVSGILEFAEQEECQNRTHVSLLYVQSFSFALRDEEEEEEFPGSNIIIYQLIY